MPPSVANYAPNAQIHPLDTAFRDAFTAHAGVSFFRVSHDKTSPSQRVFADQLHEFEFYTPAKSVGSALIIDVDRPEAVLEIFETIPPEIPPSWVVETPKGAQAGWFIDPVDLRATAREHPVRYARAVGDALRTAVAGDQSVDPLTPVRVRNPTFTEATLRSPSTPPVYRLGQLHETLRTAGLWHTGPQLTGRKPSVVARAEATAAIAIGNRNQTIFDVARFAAYAGEDFETIAWETNNACPNPLPPPEVHGIIRSINRYMSKPQPLDTTAALMPNTMRQTLVDMGRRGGSTNTPAQRTARALGTHAAARKRRHITDAKAREAQRMRARGKSRRAICEAMKVSAATVCRWLRRFTGPPSLRVSPPEPQVVRSPPGASSQHLNPQLCRRLRRGRLRCKGGSPGVP